VSLGEISLKALTRRSPRNHSYGKRTTLLMQSDSTLGKLARHSLCHAIRSEAAESDCRSVGNHRCALGSRQLNIIHKLYVYFYSLYSLFMTTKIHIFFIFQNKYANKVIIMDLYAINKKE
jgi:hypothetical protein